MCLVVYVSMLVCLCVFSVCISVDDYVLVCFVCFLSLFVCECLYVSVCVCVCVCAKERLFICLVKLLSRQAIKI